MYMCICVRSCQLNMYRTCLSFVHKCAEISFHWFHPGYVKMPRSCVVGGCTRNIVKNPDLDFSTFPRDKKRNRAWQKLVAPCSCTMYTTRGPTSNRRTGPKFAKSTLRRTLLISRVCFRTIGYTKKSIKLRRDAADGTQCRPKKPRHPTTTSRAPAQAPAMPAHSPSRRRKFGRRSLAHEKRERSRVGEPKYISLKRTNLLKCYI